MLPLFDSGGDSGDRRGDSSDSSGDSGVYFVVLRRGTWMAVTARNELDLEPGDFEKPKRTTPVNASRHGYPLATLQTVPHRRICNPHSQLSQSQA